MAPLSQVVLELFKDFMHDNYKP